MKKLLCVLLSLLIMLICCSCSVSSKQERFSSSFLDLFDTASTVIAYDNSQEDFDAHLEEFHKRLEEYYQLYDIYNSYDGVVNLNTVNETAKDKPVEVDSRIIDLLEYGKDVYELSGGKTNICFGTVLSIWHDYRTNGINNPDEATLPDRTALEEAAEHTDINSLVIDKEKSTVYFSDPELQLDVGAVAKGYAVQEVCKWASENLWSSGAISIGGNVYTFGHKDDGKSLWNIEIESPNSEYMDRVALVQITDLSVVTSGDYQRYYVVDGKKYCHVINPDTLMPSEYVASVSVICNNSALGDAFSTTLFNMSIEDGKKLVEATDGVEAVWIDKEYNKTCSSGFDKYIKN
ncbi:MAG: FAD:protein FMN transferase [Eubacterium sp.]|nr:FAD:protein FMN transferase [Eubacterium sp.]